MSGILEQANGLHVVGVAVGAGLGAVCRAAVDRAFTRRFGSTRLPWATLTVNVIGALLLGLVLGWSAEVTADVGAGATQANLADTLELVLGVGFAGGLTTFSSFSWEAWSLVREGRGRGMLAYSALTIALGLAAVAGGTLLGEALG